MKTVLETRLSQPFWLACVFFVLTCSSSVLAQVPQPGVEQFRQDRILIKPKAGREADLEQFRKGSGSRMLRRFAVFDNIQVIEVPRGKKVRQVIAQFEASGLVEFAEPDQELFFASSPNDPKFIDGSLWHLHNTGQNGGTADADIDALEGWQTLNSASNIIVAVLDSGIRYTHEDLAANMWVNPGEIPGNGIDDDGNGFIDDIHGINAANENGNPIDLIGHGTQVAGIIGAVGNNGVGTVGVSWRVKLMACRFFNDAGSGFLSDAIQCIDYARAKGAKVINASFISPTFSASFYTTISNCRSAGIIFVAAAGNIGKDNDETPYYPASYDLDNIVSVSATTRTDDLAGYSHYGATSVDLAAPGSSIYTTYNNSDSSYIINSGTSFSSPVVAGAFALMVERFPSETYGQIISRLLAATDPLPSLTGTCVTGGRLNLAAALGPNISAPQLTVAVNANLNQISIQLFGEPLREYVMQSSANNFSTWNSISTNMTDAQGAFMSIEPMSATNRFYRAYILP